MFLFFKPSEEDVDRFLADSTNDYFSYSEVGATDNQSPIGYTIDHNRIQLGKGLEVFDRAKAAICSWRMFAFNWVKLYYDDTPIEAGKTVAIHVNHFGFYSLNATRIVYTIDETNRFGFAYGTLTEHGEIGEERFSVEFDSDKGIVWYDLYAFSRPGSLLAKIGYPLSRYLQKKFAQDSLHAMQSAVKGRFPSP